MTIYDIAAEAGVSISTVSRVINKTGKVSEETRQRVEEVLEKHKYAPNALARGLVHNSLKTIGVLVEDVRNPHFSMSAYTLERVFFEYGYTTLLCNTGDDLEKKAKYIQNFAEKKVDGVVLMGSIFMEDEIKRMVRDYLPNTPIVTSNCDLDLPNVYSVFLNQLYGMELLMDYLYKKGYRNIYFVRSNDSFNTRKKIEGFLRSMGRRGLPMSAESNIFDCEYSVNGVYQFVKQFRPLCGNDTVCIFYDGYLASCSVGAFQSVGLKVPQDVAVVGYDNSRFSTSAFPQITTVDTKIDEIAIIMANMLHEVLEGRPVGNSVFVNPELIVRDSA